MSCHCLVDKETGEKVWDESAVDFGEDYEETLLDAFCNPPRAHARGFTLPSGLRIERTC